MNASPLSIRDARPDDALAILDIYAPIVTDSVISFELAVPDVDEIALRIESSLGSHAYLVAVDDEAIAGYAYATPHRARAAYVYSVETSVYIDERFRGRGIASALYKRLFERLVARGFFHAFAGITVPNTASIALHKATGFREIGVFPSVGFKFGKWHDVAWWHRPLQDGTPDQDQ